MIRNFLSLFFCFYGALVAETWAVWIGMTVFGIVLDLARKRWVLELSASPSALFLKMDFNNCNTTWRPTLNFFKRPVASVWWAANLYFIAIIVIDDIVGAEGMESYYALFKPFTSVMAQFSKMHEKLLLGLQDLGFPEEVPLADHVYAFGLASWAFWMVLVICFVRLENIRVGWSREKIFSDSFKCNVLIKKGIAGFVFFGISCSFFELSDVSARCNKAAPAFDICRGVLNFYFSYFMYFGALFGIACMSFFTFQLSLVVCGISERERNEYRIKGRRDSNTR